MYTRRSDTIEIVKTKIQDVASFPPDKQQLYFDGQILADYEELSECDVQDGSLLHLVFRLCGC